MKPEFLIELATLSPAAANELGDFATNGACSRARARRAVNAAMADHSVQGPARDQLTTLIHQEMLTLAPPAKAKGHKLMIRINELDMEELRERATMVGLSVSDYVRKRALA